MRKTVFALSMLLSASSHAVSNPPLDITVTGVKEQIGSLRIAIFNSAESFQKEPHLTLTIPVDADTMQFSVDELVAGEFAVMLFHDVDSNEKMKTNLVGMPREPWGASLEGTAIFGPPKWEDVMFKHTDAGTSLTIELH